MAIHRAGEQPGDLTLETDVVVVGSGAGGSVVAAELANAGQRVVVLEEGPHIAPERYGRLRPSEQMRRMWRDAGLTFCTGLGDTPVINVTMGRCVGGSSALTGGVCFRLPRSVLEVWRNQRGLTSITDEEMERAFSRVEQEVHVEEVPASMRSRSTKLFGEGAQKLGYGLKPMRRNTHGCEGLARCNFGCPHLAKRSVDLTFLSRAIGHGAELYSDCLVERITSEGDRATGVVGRVLNGPGNRPKGRLRVRARRVVITAGSYHSPLLLLHSGVGRRSRQVGRNLTLHPSFRMMARFDEPVLGWQGSLQSAFVDAFEGDRITLTSIFVPPGVIAATMPGIGVRHVERARAIPHIAAFGGLVHDEASGRVSRGPFGREPFVSYRMGAKEKTAARRMIRVMAETFFAAGAKEVFLPILGQPSVDADQLRALDLDHVPARRFECSSQHPLGTCRMGASPEHSVVGPDGQAWDLKELYVADGSVLPTSLGVNPQLTIMAMALRTAWKIIERPLPSV